MADTQADLESMSCEELLKELAQLAAEGDELNAEVATPQQAAPQQESQVVDLVNTRARMDRITQLLKDKGCEGA